MDPDGVAGRRVYSIDIIAALLPHVPHLFQKGRGVVSVMNGQENRDENLKYLTAAERANHFISIASSSRHFE